MNNFATGLTIGLGIGFGIVISALTVFVIIIIISTPYTLKGKDNESKNKED